MITNKKELLERLERLGDIMSQQMSEIVGEVGASYHEVTIQACYDFVKNSSEDGDKCMSIDLNLDEATDKISEVIDLLNNSLCREISYLTTATTNKR